jgi:hypothetical protein
VIGLTAWETDFCYGWGMRNTLVSIFLLVGLALAQPSSNATVDQWQEAESYSGCSLGCALSWITKTSSHLPASGSLSYGPAMAEDAQFDTCWAEGATGDGLGEYIEFQMVNDKNKADVPLSGFRIKNGYCKSAEIWKKNNRIKEMDLSVNGEVKTRFTLLDTMQSQGIRLNSVSVRPGDVVRLTIVSVYPGSTYRDTCISEILLTGAH